MKISLNLKHQALEVAQRLLENQRSQNFSGHDPFDGLNSKLFQLSGLNNFRLTRLAWIQFHKRSPINFRKVCLIPKCRNPKGIGLIILGLLKDFERTREASYLEEAKSLGLWLLSNTSSRDDWDYTCWGYPFDWQSRAFYVPEGKPNVISTNYSTMALDKLYKITKESRFAEAVVDSAKFVLQHLTRKTESGELFFAYIPGEDVLVHNANLWGAATLARAFALTGDTALKEQALSAARLSSTAQQKDGSWKYGELHHHQFIDSFHTGFNLEALSNLSEDLNVDEFSTVIEKGTIYYFENFFAKDGVPKYYNNQTFPIDMHSPAQLIITLTNSNFKAKPTATDQLIDQVLNWSISHMFLDNSNSFRYQLHRNYKNNVEYARWTQAWAYYALACFNLDRGKYSTQATNVETC